MFCVFFYFFHSFQKYKHFILSSNSRKRQFFISILPKQPRFQPNLPSNRWYIARIFQIWYAPVANKELAGRLEPIRNGEIFGMNNNTNCRALRNKFVVSPSNVSLSLFSHCSQKRSQDTN